MIFSYDDFNRLDRPITYLAKPNKKYIGTLQSRELKTDLKFNDMSEVSFKLNKYENKELTLHYDDVDLLKLVEVSNIGWFQITDINTEGSGSNEVKNITALSLENELTTKILTSFGSMGLESDEDGGLDRYYLYNSADVTHSILHIIFTKAPTWTVGYIDSEIINENRAFTNDSVDAYSFLLGDVSTSFDCIFQFDTFNKTISAYKLKNIGTLTSIYLSYRNLIKNKSIDSNSSDIKTVMYVAGGDDTGSPLAIADVNLSGTNLIYNFDYYKPWMSPELQTKLSQYEAQYAINIDAYILAIDALNNLYVELYDLNNDLPEDVSSTNWSLYGLAELEAKSGTYNTNMSIYVGKTDVSSLTQYATNYNIKSAVDFEIINRKAQIVSKDAQITNQETVCQSYVIDLEDYIGVELYKELTTYAHYTDFTDSTFIVTDIMSDAEVLQMKRDLLLMAQTELAKVCKPAYTMTIDSINFTTIPEFKRYTDQLFLGNIITVEYDDGLMVESRLLQMSINWDKLSDFSLTFSSKNRLDGDWVEFAEIQAQASGAASSQTINGSGWNNAKNTTPIISDYMKSSLDMSLQKLKSGSNEQFIIDDTGTKWKKLLTGTTYSPNQMWGTGNGLYLTKNNWENVSLAVGEGTYKGQTLYGIWADILCGNLVVGTNLNISNSSGNYTIDNDGFKATSGIYSVSINPNTPSEIFNIKVDEVNKLYVDAVNGKLKFSGDLEGASGTFGTITSGNISGATITSSTMSIGSTFSVDLTGKVISKNIHISDGTSWYGTTDNAKIYYNSTTNQFQFSVEDRVNSDIELSARSITLDCSGAYVGSDIILTSDETKKDDIQQIDYRYVSLFDDIELITFKYKDGNSGRRHAGISAQQLESAMVKNKIDSSEFGGLTIQDLENKKDYGVRYHEYQMLTALKVKSQESAISSLSSALSAQQTEINELRNQIGNLIG